MFPLPTLKEFLDNPMGKGSTAISNRQLIKDDLNKRYKQLVRKKKFDVKIYRSDDEYYFHILVPSESERDNTYDVVLHFTMDEHPEYKYDNFLNRYLIKFFSNCPSFTYTFAFVFNQYGFLIEELADKYPNEVINQGPIIRNPGEIISFEKSIYFACLHIQDSFILRNKMYLNQLSKDIDMDAFIKSIRNTDTIKMEVKKSDNNLKASKDSEASEVRRKKDSIINKAISTGNKILGKPNIDVIRPKKKITATRKTIKKITPR